jgi:hypothetical protein
LPHKIGRAAQPDGHHDIVTELGLGDDATYVFYHAQDEDRLRELEEEQKPHEIRLAWNGDGERICKILREAELAVDWDGSNDTRIRVFDTPVKPATLGVSAGQELH